MQPLPIDPYIDAIVAEVRRSRAVVVTAQPGAGKTTRVPPALVPDGPVILLQPRRVAARAIAQRIADERGWTIGDEVGWQIRFERRFSPRTRLLVATEGILTARLQQDPLLFEFKTIVLDEFHERSAHVDLAIALAKQAWRARDDLRLMVMSATLDTAAVSAFLDRCPIVEVPGRTHPVEVRHNERQTVADAALETLDDTKGDLLCFLPGALEIARAIADLEARGAGRRAEIVPLHGSLDSAAQDRALAPSPSGRRIIVATNIAETSVTVPGVTAVIDAGLHKVARYDADRGIDSLETERITQDAADQRAGRAGRLGPGIVTRLWSPTDRLRPHREPELFRIDLAATVLDVIGWGGDPMTFEWFERPRRDAIDRALKLLTRLGAVHDGKLSAAGVRMQRIPLHPRLARMLVESGGAREIARACAVLSERHFLPPRRASTTSDLLTALDDWEAVPPHVERVAREIEQMARTSTAASSKNRTPAGMTELQFRQVILAGYPDRVAQRREPRSPRVRLASGAGVVIAPESGVSEGEFLVALDVHATVSGRRLAAHQAVEGRTTATVAREVPYESEARIRLASRIERDWLQPNGVEILHRLDDETKTVRAIRVERYDALVLSEQPIKPDPAIAVDLLVEAWLARGPRDSDEQLLRRLRFTGQTIDAADLVRAAAKNARSLDDIDLVDALTPDLRRVLDRAAPETIAVPSGRDVRLQYESDGTVSAAVKLQELFGLADTPRIGPRREPVLLALLAPNGRPVQLTRDLRSFWNRTYPEVRKELRGRYPKHPWPDDPWNATPTARVKPSGRK